MSKYLVLGLCASLWALTSPLHAAKTNEEIQISLSSNTARWSNDMSTIKSILPQIELKKNLVSGDIKSIAPLLEALSQSISVLQVKLKDSKYQTADSDINSLKALAGQLINIIKSVQSNDAEAKGLLFSLMNAATQLQSSIDSL